MLLENIGITVVRLHISTLLGLHWGVLIHNTAYKMFSDDYTVVLHREYSVRCVMSSACRRFTGVCSLIVVHAEHLFFLGCFMSHLC
jgi:hypothetical protein